MHGCSLGVSVLPPLLAHAKLIFHSPAAYLGLNEGDAHVIRNAGQYLYSF